MVQRQMKNMRPKDWVTCLWLLGWSVTGSQFKQPNPSSTSLQSFISSTSGMITIFFSYTRHSTGSGVWVRFLFAVRQDMLHIPSDLEIFIFKSKATSTCSAYLAKFLWMGFAPDNVLCQCTSLLACIWTAFVNLFQSLGPSGHFVAFPSWLQKQDLVGSALPIAALFSLLGITLSWSWNRNGNWKCFHGNFKDSIFLRERRNRSQWNSN